MKVILNAANIGMSITNLTILIHDYKYFEPVNFCDRGKFVPCEFSRPTSYFKKNHG
jgi:hypothetical protein